MRHLPKCSIWRKKVIRWQWIFFLHSFTHLTHRSVSNLNFSPQLQPAGSVRISRWMERNCTSRSPRFRTGIPRFYGMIEQRPRKPENFARVDVIVSAWLCGLQIPLTSEVTLKRPRDKKKSNQRVEIPLSECVIHNSYSSTLEHCSPFDSIYNLWRQPRLSNHINVESISRKIPFILFVF